MSRKTIAPTVLLTFDVEEFDVPMECGVSIDMQEQMEVSYGGVQNFAAVLRRQQVKATLYVTANFAQTYPDLICELASEGHEIASHDYYHDPNRTMSYAASKEALEAVTGKPIYGFRSPRMMGAEDKELRKAGYLYSSSMNPISIPFLVAISNKATHPH